MSPVVHRAPRAMRSPSAGLHCAPRANSRCWLTPQGAQVPKRQRELAKPRAFLRRGNPEWALPVRPNFCACPERFVLPGDSASSVPPELAIFRRPASDVRLCGRHDAGGWSTRPLVGPRNPDVCCRRQPESRRQNSNERIASSVKHERAPDDCGIRSKAALPQRMAEKHHGRRPRLVLFGSKRASHNQANSEHRKESRCRIPRFKPLRFTLSRQIKSPRNIDERGHSRGTASLAPEILKIAR